MISPVCSEVNWLLFNVGLCCGILITMIVTIITLGFKK